MYSELICSQWEAVLPLVEKPSRYIGGEVNSVKKDRAACRLSFALAFPDTYDVGMSHLGLQILYAILNGYPHVAAERVFAPWPDMELRMRQAGIPLCTLETRTPLGKFDIVGFSLQYELTYTNVLNMLDLGGIPLYAADRKDGHPIVIAGGPCIFNPLPISPFMDAVAVGEGEELISEIAHAVTKGKEQRYSRRKILESLAEIEGIYVPSVHIHGEKIKKRTIADLDLWTFPDKPVVPLVRTIHDRINLEIARGCSRGCRFCQAGMVWRPVRERSPAILKKMVREMLASTGYEEISLLSLSAGDYTQIGRFLPDLMDIYFHQRVAISLPSLRPETLTARLIEAIKRVRKTSFTLAPEAATERLRNMINKGNSEADLLATSRQVFAAGWRSIKLYFMLGLPGEREEDLEGIVDLAEKVLKEGQYRRQVNVSLSTFVPKPHTPFQWDRQISLEETRRKQAYLKKRLRTGNLVFKWHDAAMTMLEGVFSRGDQLLAGLIESAFRNGCRFDGWSDCFNFDLWCQAAEKSGINMENYLRERETTEILPWERIDCGIQKSFLLNERDRARNGQVTPDCRFDECRHCGACTGDYTVRTADENIPSEEAALSPKRKVPSGIGRFRIHFSKSGSACFMSHLETSAALVRAIRQCGFVFVYSEGFHPHPKISFAAASAVGMESRCEWADVQIRGAIPDKKEAVEAINRHLPAGLEIIDIREVRPGSSLSGIRGFRYQITFPGWPAEIPVAEMEERIHESLSRKSFIVSRQSKGKPVGKDVRPLIGSLTINRTEQKIECELLLGRSGGVKPGEVLTQVLGLSEETAKTARIVKTEAIFSRSDP
ncbi:MAG: TIGR03960 family B12-binding radical SAM protein [Syntrophales bacterium]